MADETRVQVLKEPGRSAESQSFMSAVRTGKMVFRSSCCMDIPDEERRQVIDFLDGFQGYLKPTVIKRMASAPVGTYRRYFVDAIPQLDYNPAGVQGVHLRPPGKTESSISTERIMKQMRLEKEKPVLEAFLDVG